MPVLVGASMWVGPPSEVSESSGDTGPTPLPTFWSAELQCDPHYTDWSQYDSVHAFDLAVIPGGTYDLQAIGDTSPISLESAYSAPLTIATSVWGDVVRDCTTLPCGAPNGVVDSGDVSAIFDKFSNVTGVP